MKKYLFTLIMLTLSGNSFADGEVDLTSLKELRNASPASTIGDSAVLYFWASWCPDCREKLRGPLGNLQSEFPKVKFITINADRDEGKANAYIDAEKLALPVYRDEGKQLTKALKLFAVPAWAILRKAKSGLWVVEKSATGSDLAEIKQQLMR